MVLMEGKLSPLLAVYTSFRVSGKPENNLNWLILT